MLRAIAEIEQDPYDQRLMVPDPKDLATVVCMRVPPYGIRIHWVDQGAAFEVLSIRRIFVG